MEEIIEEKLKLNDIFGIDKYDEAIEFVRENNGTTIIEIEAIIGEETAIRQYQLVELSKPSLEELKLAKRDEINKARDEAEQGGFTYLGKVFDSDQVSCQRISCAVQAFQDMPVGNAITWTCQDNTTIALNSEQLKGLLVALATWSDECHEKANELKSRIDSATTEEELNQIVWEN